MASRHGKVAHLLNPNYKTEITGWLAEDCPSFDYAGFVVGDAPSEAKLLGKSAVGIPSLLLQDFLYFSTCKLKQVMEMGPLHELNLSLAAMKHTKNRGRMFITIQSHICVLIIPDQGLIVKVGHSCWDSVLR